MITLVTDSNAQLPDELCRSWGVRVVPLTVVVDGRAFREGVDLDCGEFYRLLARGADVSTAAPSPGEFLEVYAQEAAEGAEAVLSVHMGSTLSGTFNAARLAAAGSDVPVELVDTGTASFAVGCCVWAAADAIAAGGGLAQAADAARSVASRVGNVFVVGVAERARRSGRLEGQPAQADGMPVLALEEGTMRGIGEATDAGAAVEIMADYVRSAGSNLRVGVGDANAPELAEQLAARLAPEVSDLVRYQVGPSVAAHTGAGTVGAVFF